MNREVIAQALVIAGASIFLILGVLHGALTLQDLRHPRTFTPPDVAIRQIMQESSIAIHPQTNLWKAWMGFNLSHSLGLVMFGVTYLVISLFYFPLFAQSLWLQSGAVLIAVTYLILSLNFWFSRPVIASSSALVCLAIASGLLNVQ
jgi:hypothetical protein